MALRQILTEPNKILREKSLIVDKVDEELQKLMSDMLETMYDGNGIGLAATQVDIHKRVIVVDISNEKNDPLVLINPTINKIIDDENKSYSEGCLSVPGIFEELERPTSVEIKALGVDGKEFTLIAEDILSVVIQHEVDHLEGKMMVDYLSNLKREMIRKKMIKQKASK